MLTVDPDYASYPYLDDSTEKEVPNSVKVYKTKATNYFSVYKTLFRRKTVPHSGTFNTEGSSFLNNLVNWVRSNVFIPDPRVGWNKHAIKKAKEIIRQEKITTVITSSAPNSTHLIGLSLKKQFKNLYWISDFRDAWTKIDFYQDLKLTTWANKRHHSLEKQVLNKSDLITTIGKTLASEFSELTNTPVKVISNGYDSDDYTLEGTTPTNLLSVVYTGSINEKRNPIALWKALNELNNENESLYKTCKIDVYGEIHPSVKQSINKLSLEKIVNIHAKVNHKQIGGIQKKADVLLLIINDVKSSKHILTSKIFEYFGAQKSILNIGPTKGDAAQLVEYTKSGLTFDYKDTQGIKKHLKNSMATKKENGTLIYHGNETNLRMFTHTTLAKKLVDVIK